MDMTRDEILELLDGDRGVLIVDVRPRERFDGAHIPGAHAVPLEDEAFAAGVDGLADGDRSLPIVLIGQDAGDADVADAAERLAAFGFDDVRIYSGGMDDWQAGALPVQSGVSAG